MIITTILTVLALVLLVLSAGFVALCRGLTEDPYDRDRG